MDPAGCAQRSELLQGVPVGRPQGHPHPGPLHLVARHPQEVADCKFVVEGHQHQGNDAVVVQGPAGGVIAQVGGDAGGHRDRAHRRGARIDVD